MVDGAERTRLQQIGCGYNRIVRQAQANNLRASRHGSAHAGWRVFNDQAIGWLHLQGPHGGLVYIGRRFVARHFVPAENAPLKPGQEPRFLQLQGDFGTVCPPIRRQCAHPSRCGHG